MNQASAKLRLLPLQVLVPVIILVSAGTQALSVSYDDSVGSAADDEIKMLPNLVEPITFTHYSGYLNADESETKFLHYWFVEAEEDPASKPLLLWLNGGPGCSSLGGLFDGVGPFEVQSGGAEAKLREHSWNKLANVIFLESPATVGFSYSKDDNAQAEDDDSTADSNYLALKSFMNKFEQYKNHSLYIAGESYAAVYLTTLGLRLDNDDQFNFKGIAIGNGLLDEAINDESLIYFAYYHGLLSEVDWKSYSLQCCDGQPPTRQNCLRRQNPECLEQIQSIRYKIWTDTGINLYNIYGDCDKPKPSEPEKRLRKFQSRYKTHKSRINITRVPYQANIEEPAEQIPCLDPSDLIAYLGHKEVREALHIPDDLDSWNICTSSNYSEKYAARENGLTPEIMSLVQSDRKLTLLIYNGDTDAVCSALGGRWFVEDLGLKPVSDYQSWTVDEQVAGWVQHYEGITYATVRGAGHMVARYKPREAFALIEAFLNSSGPNVHLEEINK